MEITGTPSMELLQKRIKELESQLEDYRALVANTPDLLYRTDQQGRITFVSPSVETLSGYSVNEAIGMKMADEVYLHPHERERFLGLLQKYGSVRNFEAQLKRKDGSLWWASTNAHCYRDAQMQIQGVEGITRDVSDLKNAETALRKSEELFRLAFHTSPDAINLNRASDGLFLDINEGFTELMGYTRQEVLGKTSLSLNIWHDPADRTRLVEGLRQHGHVKNLEAKFFRKDGSVGVGLMSACFIQIEDELVILSITRDINDRLHLEQQLRQAQKFEALGTLAGGIAHDFNNILMGILGRTSLIGVNLEENDPNTEHVQAIEKYVSSAKGLTRQILGFARAGRYQTAPLDIGAVLERNAALFGRTNKQINIHIKGSSTPVVVEADQQQLEQVLLNIFVNAKQAMAKGGDLFIESGMATLSDQSCSHLGIPAGTYCRITVTDTGTGMDEVTRLRAFDPFFTTKEKERGTGLGLASALGIIRDHGGAIHLSSELNRGTTVEIFLPLSAATLKKKEKKERKLASGGGVILLIDDETMITEVGGAMLEALGYQVITVNSGAVALETLAQRRGTVDLVILDLIMPEMDGQEVFKALRRDHPRLPVLLSSGYSQSGQIESMLEQGCNGFLQKPFNLQELSFKIREVLSSASTP